jgi:predicted  nucleic acid-binding Zn-ribbon protein
MNSKTAEVKSKIATLDREISNVEDRKNEYLTKLKGFNDLKHEIDIQKEGLAKEKEALCELDLNLKKREDAVKQKEAEIEDEFVRIQVLNRRVDEKIEIHKLRKELDV